MFQKKSLGQNFLTSKPIAKSIVEAGRPNENETIVEIGPGKGFMTEEILKVSNKVIAIEKDHRLIPILEEKFKSEISSGKLRVIEADILELDMSRTVLDINGYKVIANIPYYITGQIIRKFLESDFQPSSMTMLVQKEVAERIVARNKKESLLSLSVKVFGDPKIIRTVGRGAFSPAPNVDSAVLNIVNISMKNFTIFSPISIIPRVPLGITSPVKKYPSKGSPWMVGESKKLEELEGVSPELFFEVIHAGFAHKRKQLLPNLSSLYNKEKLVEIFNELNLDPKSRAEDISLNVWLKICNLLLS